MKKYFLLPLLSLFFYSCNMYDNIFMENYIIVNNTNNNIKFELPEYNKTITLESQKKINIKAYNNFDINYDITKYHILQKESYIYTFESHNLLDFATIEPTCTEEGSFNRKCKICHYIQSEVLPLYEHSYIEVVQNNTVILFCTKCKSFKEK